MTVKPRAAFVTIGQTPRSDLIPELRDWIGDTLDIEEFGALDGLTGAAIARMALRPGDPRLATRLADGTQAIVGKDFVHERLQTIFDELASRDFFCTVLLCTGQFQPFRVRGMFLEAQSIVDQSVAAIAHHARTIGVMVPVREQIEAFHFRPSAHQRLEVSDASPYLPGRLEEAARELADTDLIVMHCIGYTAAMRRSVAAVANRPVLLARKLVAAAVGQLV